MLGPVAVRPGRGSGRGGPAVRGGWPPPADPSPGPSDTKHRRAQEAKGPPFFFSFYLSVGRSRPQPRSARSAAPAPLKGWTKVGCFRTSLRAGQGGTGPHFAEGLTLPELTPRPSLQDRGLTGSHPLDRRPARFPLSLWGEKPRVRVHIDILFTDFRLNNPVSGTKTSKLFTTV